MDTINWIRNMVKVKNDLTVSGLILPGSNNSASYMVRPGKRVKCFSLDSSALYQEDSIYDQLKKGVRMLYIRVLLDPRTKRLRTHSRSQNVDFDAVLKQLKAFLLISKDVVFVQLIAHDQSAAHAIKLAMRNSLPDVITEISNATALNETKIENLLKNQKRVVIISCPVRINSTKDLMNFKTDAPAFAAAKQFDILLYQRKPKAVSFDRKSFKSEFNKTFSDFVFAHEHDTLKQINAVLFDFATSSDMIKRLILMSYLRCGIIQ